MSGNPRYSFVQIFDGGTIEADNHEKKALDITGSLTIATDGTLRKALHENPTFDALHVRSTATDAVVNLAGNLELSLHYAPTLYDWIVLLSTDGNITGSFETVNGVSLFGEDNDFFILTYSSESYLFQISYDYDLGGGETAVALQYAAIPEPQTVAFLAGAMGLMLVFLRRRRA